MRQEAADARLDESNVQIGRLPRRAAVNLPIKGTAADIMKAMIDVHAALTGSSARMIHDGSTVALWCRTKPKGSGSRSRKMQGAASLRSSDDRWGIRKERKEAKS
jgi:hypothetical protein